MVMQILAATPKWVFAVFFILVYYGYLQSRTRQASKGRVIMLPMIMIILSVGGLFSSFGGHLASLAAWVVGFVAALAANRVIQAPVGVTFDPTTQRFHLPGSWVPLILMMAFYFAKYTVGATTAVRPDILATLTFTVILSGLFGVLSGTFFARFLHIWSTTRTNESPAASQNWEPTV